MTGSRSLLDSASVGGVVLIGHPAAGIAETKPIEAAIHEAQRLDVGGVLVPDGRIGGLGQGKRLFRLAIERGDLGLHPQNERRRRRIVAARTPNPPRGPASPSPIAA